MRSVLSNAQRRRRGARGFTLEEVCISLALGGVTLGSLIAGYLTLLGDAEYAVESAAAQTLATQRVEQIRAAKWDLMASPPVDEVVTNNFPDTVQALGVPVTGTNVVNATLKTSIRSVSTDPPLKVIQVDCVWSCLNRGTFTNTVVAYRGPDQ